MNRIFISATIILIFCISWTSIAEAGLLGGYYCELFIRPMNWPNFQSFDFTFYCAPINSDGYPGDDYFPSCGPLFQLSNLTPANVGSAYTVDSGLAFEVAEESLTNGSLDGYVWHLESLYSSKGGHGTENWFWFVEETIPSFSYQHPYYGGLNGLDFEGFAIDYWMFRLNKFEDLSIDFSLELYGEPIPEPGTMGLLAVGAFALVKKRRR